MTRTARMFCLSLALLAACGLSGTAFAAGNGWTYPAIKGYGPVHPLPDAAVQPSKHKVYKAFFDVTKGTSDPSKPNPGFDHVARAVNVFASAGVPLKHLHFVAVAHGPATPAVLNNAEYKKKFGVDNPNIKMISELKKAGVKVEVCGQALADNHFEHAWVNKDVIVTLSALSDAVIYGNKGYAFVKQ
ncbi:MAG TPA: DsrE family protein [Gammaproteobacteria bacterium]|nr:DsrE family protein [Gammaproteobacteria bacterium]